MSFDSAVAHATKLKYSLSILLGNGFSRAFSEDFRYARLRDVSEMSDLSVTKDQLFDHAASDDFETVIQHLRQSARLVELYEPTNTELRRALLDDANVVKRGLVDALSSIHPASAWQIEDERYRSARQFLSHFGKIFTLNYDLLVYWTVLQRNLSPPAVVMKDGFGRPGGGPLTWSQPIRADGQEIFYLHGAMHYYVEHHQVRKLEVSNGNIVDQLQSNLLTGRYPLVVTEGSQDDKEARIARSAYLTYGHRRLARLNGALFIHGMAMSDNDQHILNAIADKPSGVDAIYIGLHGGPSKTIDGIRATARELVRTRAMRGGRTLSVKFYQSETASIWG
jgi:uncharacterized protein with PIN domain